MVRVPSEFKQFHVFTRSVVVRLIIVGQVPLLSPPRFTA